jgi:hypothetical protein
MADWVANISLERGTTASGDIVFIAIDAIGSPSSLDHDWLERLKISPKEVPDEKLLAPGYYFAPIEKPRVCFIVTLGKGDVEAALIRNLTAAFSSKEAFEAREVWLPLLGTSVGNLEDRKSLRAILIALRDSKTLSRQVNIIISTPSNISGEDFDRLDALRRAAQTSGEIPPDSATDFAADRVAEKDLLDTIADASALAKLICLKGAAPLAVAIFGGWGSGKSTFMSLIESEIDKIMPAESEAAKSPTPKEGLATFVRRVVHIRFNAWQFVDANLWVSLTAEFFDQLRAGGHKRSNDARYAGLVEDVNSHVHALSEVAKKSRRAAAEAGKRVLNAQNERDDAAKEARQKTNEAIGQAAIDSLKELYDGQRPQLRALGLGEDTEKSIGELIDVVRDSASTIGRFRAVYRLLKSSSGPRLITMAAAVILLLAALLSAFGVLVFLSNHAKYITALVSAIASIGVWAAAAAPAIKLVRSVSEGSAKFAYAISTADADATKKLLKKEVDLSNAIAEADASKEAEECSARALARYIDPTGAPAPSRLLRFVLEDDPDTKELEKEIGLIGRTRRLFQAVNGIITKKEKDGEAPDRIILYVDDLDRCPEDKVYDVLQAIHLLLAFESFVVVVGVDVTWVQNALARDLVGADENVNGNGAIKKQRTIEYLEKIFQIAFWLSPLTTGANNDGTYAQYLRGLVKAKPVNSGNGTGSSAAGAAPVSNGAAEAGSQGTASNQSSADNSKKPPPGPTVELIQLEQKEIDFLASQEIGAIAPTTPRSVKRLINIYRLVRTRLGESRADLMGENGAAVYPIIALASALETRQAEMVGGELVHVADLFYQFLKAAPPQESLERLSRSIKPSDSSKAVFDACPRLKEALLAVASKRSGSLEAQDFLTVARVARRYSFNREESTVNSPPASPERPIESATNHAPK